MSGEFLLHQEAADAGGLEELAHDACGVGFLDGGHEVAGAEADPARAGSRHT
ncbi:hypothetical protein AB0J35_53985 [Nonomuraea angiospora]|uniref:hypothetical protein n=1 Tax=Nonomuraea angiospora TaxID=46172 RepID=UPI003415D245